MMNWLSSLWSRLVGLKWNWLTWEVLLPLGLPTLICAIEIAADASGPEPVKPRLAVIFDYPPWSLTFYSLVLLAVSLRKLNASGPPTRMFWAMLLQAGLAAYYSAKLALWRQDSGYEPGIVAYSVAIAILISAIGTSYANA